MPLWLAAVLLPEPGACPRSSAGAQKTEPTAKAFFMPLLSCVQGAAKISDGVLLILRLTSGRSGV